MAYDNVTDYYANPILTQASIRFSNDPSELLAEKIFKILPVVKKTGFIFKYDKSNLKTADDRRTGEARANRANYGLIKVSYGPLIQHALEIPIEEDIMEMYDNPLDPQVDATLAVTEMFELNKEAALATLLQSTTNVTQYASLSGTSLWSDYANSTPFTDIETGVKTIIQNAAKTPNTLVMGYEVWSVLKNHPDFLERIKYSQLGTLTESLLSDLINIPNIMIGKAVYNAANDGQTDSLSFVWGKYAWLMYIAPAPALRSVSAGWTLTLLQYRKVDSWYEIWNTTTFVRIRDYYQFAIISTECMYMFPSCVA